MVLRTKRYLLEIYLIDINIVHRKKAIELQIFVLHTRVRNIRLKKLNCSLDYYYVPCKQYTYLS